MLNISESVLQVANGPAYPLRTFGWADAPLLDACGVRAEYGHLLVLTADGELCGIDLCTGAHAQLCTVDLPHITLDNGGNYFGMPRHRLHTSTDGRYAAIVVDHGRGGIVVETQSGAVTMRLDGGDYHEDTVPFSACFLRHDGRDVFVHRTAWNRVDAANPATGKSLADRHIAPYEGGGERPAHYLDYFHGQLRPSPDGSLVFDDGWVWHPVSIPRVWSVTNWLRSNPWESEDGPSIVDLAMRDDWNKPACWTSERHIAQWGTAYWDEEEFEETGQGPGVRILDVTDSKPSPGQCWRMEINAEKVFDLFSDGVRLYVAADTGTTVWNLASRMQVAELPGFTAHLLDQSRNTLLAFGPDTIQEFSLPWPSEK
ncbi:MAG: hypothetical protein ABI605_05745 [Rhizobacter sp.]